MILNIAKIIDLNTFIENILQKILLRAFSAQKSIRQNN